MVLQFFLQHYIALINTAKVLGLLYSTRIITLLLHNKTLLLNLCSFIIKQQSKNADIPSILIYTYVPIPQYYILPEV